MASDWDNGDHSYEPFDSILSENPTFGDQPLDDDLLGFISQTTELEHEPYSISTAKSSHASQSNTLAKSQDIQPQSTLSSLSPESSVHDSSSDSSGRRKRKTSSTSSPTPWPKMNSHMNSLKVSDQRQEGVPSTSQTPKGITEYTFGSSPTTSFAVGGNLELSDKSLAPFFDIDSAAASPGAFGTMNDLGSMMASTSPMMASDAKKRRSGMQRMTPMATSTGTFFLESRDQSPLDGNVNINQTASSAMMFSAGPSPPDQYNIDSTWSGAPNNLWDSNNYGLDTMNFSPSPVINNRVIQKAESNQETNATTSQLHIDPTTRKSRVETQIPIKLTLTSLLEGVTKLHLPTHTIAKPKMLAKEVRKAPDTLELYVMLVCASAMKDDKVKQRAFRLAAGTEQRVKKENPSSNRSSPQQGETDDDPDKPLNGGEVRICKNCINREAKRAARKKIKSPDDESHWRQYENDRVVVFNTHEYKDWKPWEPTKPENGLGPPENQPSMPEGSMMVEVPMRIACYCRHQGEKDGFQIIFTIKDSTDHLIAQNISESILITDDHKTQPGAIMPDTGSSSYVNLPSAAFMASEQASQLSRGYHSTPDLLALQQHPQTFLPQQQLYHSSKLPPSKTTFTTETPKNLSRPASPDGSSSGPNKKRKSSGPGPNRYSGLMMTPMTVNTAHQAPQTSMPPSAGPIPGATPPSQFSSFSPQRFTFPQTTEGAVLDGSFQQTAGPSYFTNEPPSRVSTRNGSFSNNYYSAPGSQMPSRASSPISHRPNHSYQNHLAQRVQANFNHLSNSAIASPTEAGPSLAPPMIHKLSPAEGPLAGNTEVSVYGSGFYPGLDVIFGNTPAISTTYWGEKALLCVLPPSSQPGPVNVTFSAPMQTMFPSQPVQAPPAIFTYKDDQKDKRDLLELFKKMMTDQGQYVPDNYMDYMQSYMPGSSSSYQRPTSGPHGGLQNYNHSYISAMLGSSDTEEAILKFLQFRHQGRGYPFDVDVKSKDGSTLLSLASRMGYARAVAALLACQANADTRDANGFTPLINAAVRGHIHVIHLLLRKGADPTVRTLQGCTAVDLASSDEVRVALVHVPNHSRNSSGLRSLKSGRSSPDLRSLNSFYTTDDSGSSSDEDASRNSNKMVVKLSNTAHATPRYQSRPHSRLQSRRNSLVIPPPLSAPPPAAGDQQNFISPYAAMTAWRDSLSVQIQHFQENVHRNLPNFPNWQLPALPPLPNLPDYQDHPMMRRISSLVPNRHPSPPPESSATSSSDETQRPTEVNQSFWDFFSSASAPPSYEDLYPQKQEQDRYEEKKAGVVEAAAEAILDQKCGYVFDRVSCKTLARCDTMACSSKAAALGQPRLKTVGVHKALKVENKVYYLSIPILIALFCAMVKPSLIEPVVTIASSFFYQRSNYNAELLRQM